MRYWLTALALLASTAIVSAETFALPEGYSVETVDPPARWLTAPYAGTIEVMPMPRVAVNKICRDATGAYNESAARDAFAGTACAFVGVRTCQIILYDDLAPDYRANVLKHEEAHCRGWPADHPTD